MGCRDFTCQCRAPVRLRLQEGLPPGAMQAANQLVSRALYVLQAPYGLSGGLHAYPPTCTGMCTQRSC